MNIAFKAPPKMPLYTNRPCADRTRWRYYRYRRFLGTSRAYTIVAEATPWVKSIGQEHAAYSQTSQEALCELKSLIR